MKTIAEQPVCESLRAALRGIIDYAGRYPPAQLPLAEAFADYLKYRDSAESWLLGQFVAPVGELDDLATEAGKLPMSLEPAGAAIICRTAPTVRQWREQWIDDVGTASNLVLASSGGVTTDAIEAKLPEELACGNADRIAEFAVAAADFVGQCGLPTTSVFLEIPLGPAWESTLAEHAAGLARAAQQRPNRIIGLKLRTGGLQPAAFPSVEQVASVIDACRRHQLCWKATAGLHHPLRQHRAEVNCHMHGFINVAAAAALAAVHDLPAERLVPILADESPEHFKFDAVGMSWNDLRATVEQINASRRVGPMSFGSCSFDEPRADLVARLAAVTEPSVEQGVRHIFRRPCRLSFLPQRPKNEPDPA